MKKKLFTKKGIVKTKKTVKKLQRKVDNMYQVEHECNTYSGGVFVRQFLGLNPLTNEVDMLGLAQVLTTVGQQLGAQGRRSNKVKFLRLRGRVSVNLTNAAKFTIAGVIPMRAQIIKINSMKGGPGAHTLPLINDVITGQNPLTLGDVNAYASINRTEKSPNYRIVWDKRFDLCMYNGATIPCKKSGSKSGIELEPQYLGTASSFQLTYDIKCDNSITTYDYTGNDTASCNENHYVLVVWNSSLIVDNVPFISYTNKSTYIPMP